jgi:hypothetical protein
MTNWPGVFGPAMAGNAVMALAKPTRVPIKTIAQKCITLSVIVPPL